MIRLDWHQTFKKIAKCPNNFKKQGDKNEIEIISDYGIMVLLCCITSVYAQEKLTWMVLDWPPLMMLNGKDQENGRFNHLLRVAMDALSEYDHFTEEMNWARFWHEVENGRNICYIFGVKTRKRQDLVYYSLPHTFLLPNEIIIKKTDLQKFCNPTSYCS
jgi:uncharacterized protein (TIGR02285 family)